MHFESWIKQILFGGSLNFLYIDKWYMWWISSFIFGKIRIGMFAECLTPVALHVMCCYFGMWTRHWPLLNDDSSKKEGKNVGGAPWCLEHYNVLARFFILITFNPSKIQESKARREKLWARRKSFWSNQQIKTSPWFWYFFENLNDFLANDHFDRKHILEPMPKCLKLNHSPCNFW